MGEIEPSLKNDGRNSADSPPGQKPDMKGPEWEDNEFAV